MFNSVSRIGFRNFRFRDYILANYILSESLFRFLPTNGFLRLLNLKMIRPSVFPPETHNRIHKSQNLPVAQMGAGKVGSQSLQTPGTPERSSGVIRVCGYIIHVKCLLKLLQDALQVSRPAYTWNLRVFISVHVPSCPPASVSS